MEIIKSAKRGTPLTLLILIMGSAFIIGSLVVFYLSRLESLRTVLPSWAGLYALILLVGRLVALAAIWNMKRWGVYTLLFFGCIEVSLGLFVFTSLLTFPLRALIAIPSLLVLIGIWYLVLRERWQAFT